MQDHHIKDALSRITLPDGQDIVTAQIVESIQTRDGQVVVTLKVDPAQGATLEPLRQEVERTLSKLPDIRGVTAILTAERAPGKEKPPRSTTNDSTTMDPHGMAKNPPLSLPIKTIICVASGKGGVGKSTVAFNLAIACARAGLTAGLLDADIYGPSVPKLAGLGFRKPDQIEGKLQPLEAHGLKLMSMGFMVEEERAMIWRGPMVQTAIYQMLRDVDWGREDKPLDVLVVDMPPGTGDAQLTMAQKVPLNGAVIVSTPQDLALIDARKAVAMFEKVNVPVLGLIENMSTYICPSCGHEDHIFGHGGAENEAQKLGLPFLGRLPLNGDIRAKSDAGTPISYPLFDHILEKIKHLTE